TYDELLDAAEEAARLYGASSALTFGEWMKRFLAARELAGRHEMRSHRAVWRSQVRHSRLVTLRLRSITSRHVRQWVHEMEQAKARAGKRRGQPLSHTTIGNALHLASQAFEAAIV